MKQFLTGNCLEVLPTLPAQSVQCVVTSPPYLGIRDYKLAPTIWDGPADCAHAWGQGVGKSGDWCQHCGAWRGCLGLEPTPQLFVRHIVQVFAEVWRVLRDDGTLWLNLGDSYFYGPSKQCTSLKPKDMCGIPWRVALALQDAGWYLRSDIIWHKTSPMPESVCDRPTRAHEYLFLLTKEPRYFYDAEAVKEPAKFPVSRDKPISGEYSSGSGRHDGGMHRSGGFPSGATRNLRSVWTLSSEPFPGAHFATFCPALVERCLRAGTSAHGCCTQCGAPWKRQTARRETGAVQQTGANWDTGAGGHGAYHRNGREVNKQTNPIMETVTTGWAPTCHCEAGIQPCTALDPFGGAGTVALVAQRLALHAIMVEQNPAYVQLAEERIRAEFSLLVSCERMADVSRDECDALEGG